ncbi:MAG: oligosaccharide flippase family protein, partial [Bacteroidales bacterium]|nr:oligosaccharide flippase family protein [Bacteroidales bacterium]
IFVLYSKINLSKAFKRDREKPVIKTKTVTRELLTFSLPLLGVALIHMIISWTDTLMLGGFLTSNEVGLYNAASPLATLIILPMTAMLLIYAPIISGLYAKNSLNEIRKNYTVLTKWVFVSSLPPFILLFLFPDEIIYYLFGSNYVLASQSLRILSLGYIISNLLGPNGTTIMAVGKTRFLMLASATAACINIILNLALIPQLGITGAAIATASSIVIHCVIRHIKVHSILKISSLTKNLIKPGLVAISLIFIISYLVKNYLEIEVWMLPLLFILFYVIYFMAILATRSFDNEDLMMLLEIEKKMGINIAPLKKILSRFL